ncbi:MAG TPA: DUF6263 family protein, partial [Planctomycetota bacterium]|nr:DUF6263 family protein [Planctomycetota bacterium]
NIDYDSADPIKKDVDHPALTGFKALVGRTVTVKMSPRGEVTEVKGLKEIAEAVLAEVPAGPAREAARRQLEVMFDEKNYSERMGGLNLVYPEEPVGVGDSWDKEQKISMGFINMIVKTTYTVKAVGNTVDIDLNSTIEPGEAPDAGMGLTTTIEQGTQKGLMKVQRDNAGLMSGEITQDLKMTISIQGRSIAQTLKAVTSYSTTRK